MKCVKCNNDFSENLIKESHDVPLYLFQGIKRSERKQQADKLGRKHLCERCHNLYEAQILQVLYLNLLHKNIPLLITREERKPYFPKIWRLSQDKKDIGIKICLKTGRNL